MLNKDAKDLDICHMLDIIESYNNITIYSKTIPDHYNVFQTFFNPQTSNIKLIITPGYGIEVIQKIPNVHYLDTITKPKDSKNIICISCSNGFFMKLTMQKDKMIRYDLWQIYSNSNINKCPIYELMSKCSNISILKNIWDSNIDLDDVSYTTLGIKWMNESDISE